mgnify:CR=1 FL=1
MVSLGYYFGEDHVLGRLESNAVSSDAALLDRLCAIAGADHVRTEDRDARCFTHGFRYGGRPVMALVRPRSLVGMWRALNTAVEAGCAVILPTATGLGAAPLPVARIAIAASC